MALALIVLATAGLLIRTFIFLHRVNLGFNPRNVLTLRVPLNGPRYADQDRQAVFFEELIRQVETLPNVVDRRSDR